MPKLPIQSPNLGVNRVVPREGQPPETCWDALNVLPYDRFGRRRVAQRSGLIKQYVAALGSTAGQGLLGVNNIAYPAVLNTTGITFYNEAFASLGGFEQNWSNVPSTWSVVSTPTPHIHVPASTALTNPPATFTGAIPAAGAAGSWLDGSMTIGFTLTTTGSTLATSCFVFTFHLNASSTSGFPLISLNVTASQSPGLGIIFTGNINANGSQMGGNASPAAINSSTASMTVLLTVTGDGTQFGATYSLTVGSGAGSNITVSGQQNVPSSLSPTIAVQTLSDYTLDFQ
jgi:hypothetical protein